MPLSKPFAKSVEVRWADCDPNRHLRHTAYNDYATHVRFRYLEENGFGGREFARLRLGPVIFREETRFFKEVRMGEAMEVDFQVAALSPTGARFHLLQEIHRRGGELAAVVRVEGAWLNVETRKLVEPPPELVELIRALPRTADYRELPDREPDRE